MTALVAAFKEWEHQLMSVHDEITVFSDNKNLEYFNSTKVLNRRQHFFFIFFILFILHTSLRLMA